MKGQTRGQVKQAKVEVKVERGERLFGQPVS
jgi:hypothetical protein